MRISLLSLVAMSSVLCVTACNPEFDAAEKNNRKEIAAGHDEMTLRLAIASESANDLANAERLYLQLNKDESPQSTIELAGFYNRHNQSAHAVEILQKASEKSPKDANLKRTLANSLISAGNPERALSLLDSAIAEHQGDAYLYSSRGVALDKLNRYSDAQQSYQKAIELSPENAVDFRTNLSMSHILAGKYDIAIALLEPLASGKDSTPGIRQNLALAYGLKGDMDMAMKMGSKDLSIKEMNENIRFYSILAKGHKGNGATIAQSIPDAFPMMLPPPSPTAAEEPITQTSIEPSPITTAPKITAANETSTASSETKPQAVRNLSHTATSKETAPSGDNGVAMKIIRPTSKLKPESSLTSLAPSAKGAEENELTDSNMTKSSTGAKPVAAFDGSKIPTPVLKPDKW